MANELDRTDTADTPSSPAAPTLMEQGVTKLRQHAELKAMALDYAKFITETANCPDIYRNKPNDAAAAIIRGTSLGFDPDGALEAFFVIKGKTGMYARAQIAVAEKSGCTVWEDSASDEAVTWCGTRPGSDKVESVTWTMERAKRAGYATNGRYKTNATEMLRAKCQAELARILAPGALMGLYSEQEPAAFEPTTVKATSRRMERLKALSAKASGGDTANDEGDEGNAGPSVDAAGRVDRYLNGIAAANSRASLRAYMADLDDTGLTADEVERVKEAANTRWEELDG